MLTERIVRDAQPGQKTRILWDSTVKGLGLRITPNGVKSYILNYRSSGRERRATLARASETSLKTARKVAGEQLVRIRSGETDPLDQRKEAKEAPSMAEAMFRFFDSYAPDRIALGKMTARTAKEYRYQWEHYLAPKLARRKVAEVEPRHVEQAVARTRTTTRNRLLALLSRCFTLFETWGMREQNNNPARGVERGLEEPRDRTLSATELAALARALDDAEAKRPAAVAAIRLAALTGLRIGEILGIRWEHVDIETGRLVLPETKTGRRIADMPPPALVVIESLPRFNQWMFTTGRGPCTYRYIRCVFSEVCTAAGLCDVRLHDLRRSYMTQAAAIGANAFIVRDLLGHKSTAQADAYVRAAGSPIRETRAQVSSAIATAMKGETSHG